MPSTHLIRAGDTLSALSRKYGTTVDALVRLNGIANRNLIYTGRTLKLPGHSGADTFTPAPPRGGSLPGQFRGSQSLVQAARAVDASMAGTGYCATAVTRAIGRAMNVWVGGDGNTIGPNLVRSGRFREVNISLEEALKIPGLVLTWQSSRSEAGKKYGHTAITAGDGHTSISDFTESYTTNSGRSGLRVYMPV